MTFYRLRVGASSLLVYFSVGVWECRTRLNKLALTKQHKINTGDWGYNNTQQPLVSEPFWTTHKSQEVREDSSRRGF